ncbi:MULTISPECIES: hypothetical protein [unclassified Prevotella]|uniref:hypothetical protein n=1 Tax=unclassified Prevotella TaxID=2638335 RepID=UPI0004911164|nr:MULTISPECIES: hypothetical protein [unclassified Prevotella]
MKKLFVLSLGTLLLLSSCGTYTEAGATTGGWFGSIIGSAIGGIAGGPRGSDIGTLIGMAGGAVVGAAVGQAAEEAHQKKMGEYQQRRMERGGSQRQEGYDYPDDRIYMECTSAPLEIRRPMLIDNSRDQVLTRGEEARIVFEVYNTTNETIYRICPNVKEITGNKHLEVSDNVMIESIAPGKGIRYTALVRADNGLRDGEAVFRIGVFQGDKEIASQTRDFRIQTSKR